MFFYLFLLVLQDVTRHAKCLLEEARVRRGVSGGGRRVGEAPAEVDAQLGAYHEGCVMYTNLHECYIVKLVDLT